MKNRNYSKLKETIDNFVCEYQDDEELGEMVKGLISGNPDGNMVLCFEGDVGTRYRVIATYLGKDYIVCWFQFCEDGSLYFGVRDKNSEPHATGQVKSLNGQISIRVTDDALPPALNKDETKERFSFHGSGEIHDGQIGHTTYREPIIRAKEQSELFWACFKELNLFEEIQHLKRDDISLMINIQEKHALMLHVLIAPSNKTQLHGINDGKNNMFILIDYHGIREIGDVTLQLVFAPGINAEVPPHSIVVWPTKDIEEIREGWNIYACVE